MTQNSKIKVANSEDMTMNTNERILRDCHNLYTDPKDGKFYFCSSSTFSLFF